jgi:hypothetical protein
MVADQKRQMRMPVDNRIAANKMKECWQTKLKNSQKILQR